MALFNWVGDTELSLPIHNCFNNLAYAVDNYPFVPKLFYLLISVMYLSAKK